MRTRFDSMNSTLCVCALTGTWSQCRTGHAEVTLQLARDAKNYLIAIFVHMHLCGWAASQGNFVQEDRFSFH
jgi:hypothetical protein